MRKSAVKKQNNAPNCPKFAPIEELLYQEHLKRELAESSLYEFVKQAWHIVEPGKPFVDGWHIRDLCLHLECVYYGSIRKLLINMPPRMSKSTVISIIFPAWVWVKNASKQILNSSYKDELSRRNVVICRRLITSDWFQFRWGNKFEISIDQNEKHNFHNNHNGYYQSFSTKKGITGFGGDIKICDDPNNSEQRDSDVILKKTNDWFSTTWSTRYNNIKEVADIVVMQRLSILDVSGHIIENDTSNRWVKLILPMRFDPSRKSKTIILPGTSKPWEDPRKKQGDLLCPERIGQDELDDVEDSLRATRGEYEVSGQMQQLPAPDNSGILKRSKFAVWKKPQPPQIELVISSWDTAIETNDLAAHSAATTWGTFKCDNGTYGVIFLGMWNGRVEFPELIEMAKRLHKDYRDDGQNDITPNSAYKSDIMLIEAKASGSPLIQSLHRSGINAVPFKPPNNMDKTGRARYASAFLDSGQIYVPGMPPNYTTIRPKAASFVDICSMFPMSPKPEHKDIVDTFSQVIMFLTNNGYLTNTLDPRSDPVKKKNIVDFYGVR